MKTQWFRSSALAFCTLGALFLLGTGTAHAATKTWDGGGGDGLWMTAANWDGDSLPGSGDDVVLDNTSVAGNYTVTLNGASAQTVRSVQVGYSGNANTITLSVSGNTTNVLTLNGGAATALHVTDGGIVNNQSTSGTRGIKLSNSTDVFKMSGTGSYIHNSGGNLPELTSGTTSANYNFASTSVFEYQTTGIDNLPNYGTLKYNVASTKSVNASLTLSGDLIISQGELGVCAGTSSTFTISGNVAISSGATFRGSGGTCTATINVTGNLSGAGTFQANNSGATTNVTVGGSITSNVLVDNGTSSSLTFSGGTASVSFTPANGTTPAIRTLTVASGKTVTVGRAVSIASSFTWTVDSGGTLATFVGITNNGTFNVNGAFQINNGGFVSGTAPTYASTSTLKYNCNCTYGRSLEWSATSGAGYPGNLQLSNNTILNYPNGSTAARSMSGNLTIDSGSALYMDYGSPGMNNPLTVAGNLVLNGSLSLGDAVGGDLNLAGNWTNSGTFYPNSRAVTFNGASAQSITGATTFDYLTLNNTNGLSLNNNVTVNQTLTLSNGKIDTGSSILTLGCNASVSGASSSNYILGNLNKSFCATGSFTYPTGTANGYSPVDVTLTALATNPSSLQIIAVQSNAPGLADAKALDRYWSLTETGDLTANLTFHYLDGDVDGNESDYRVYKGTTDMCGSSCVDTGANTVTVSGISAFSNWSAGEASAPTVLDLTSFTAKSTRKHKVRVEWETGNELNLIGFNVYRSNKRRGGYEKLNTELIPAQNIGQAQGAPYKFMDRKVQVGTKYFYKLELIRAIGGDALTPPIKVVVK